MVGENVLVCVTKKMRLTPRNPDPVVAELQPPEVCGGIALPAKYLVVIEGQVMPPLVARRNDDCSRAKP